MKILIINLRIGTGSVGRIVSDLYHGITEKGNECKIAYARGTIGDVPIEDTYRICSDNEIRAHALLTRLFGNTAFYFKNSTKKLCDWIVNYNPDIVHIHGVYGYYLNMEELFDFFAKCNFTVISTLHSCWDFTGHCCYFDYIGCEKWKQNCDKCIQKNTYPKSSFLDNTKKNYLRKKRAYIQLKKCIIVTPSEWLSKYASESFLNIHKITVINNGIDLDSFKPSCNQSNYISSDKPSILCIANIWDKRKGWDDIVNLSYYLDDSIQLVVVGLNKKQCSKLKKGTITIERTNNKRELAELYSSATVFFNPTYEDNYPTVNLEAAACHTPVVTYLTGGSPEILKFGNWGKIIKKKDFDELIKYTRSVYDQSITIDFNNTNLLSRENMVNQYLNLYNSVNVEEST